MGIENVELVTVAKPENKKSLCQRYEIPIENLSYEHISRTTDTRELERMILILRSGEEGYYPDLARHAEERLAGINPESKILRIEEPVIKRDMLAPERRKKLENDINEWMSEMRLREKDLEEGRAMQIKDPIPQPEIRQTAFNESKKKQRSSESRVKSKRINACDYAAWDKYDADTELNRIDLQHEQEKAETKRTQQKLREKEEKAKASREAVINNLTLTGTEFNVMAEEERKKGNEAFKAGDYKEALQFYDLSIAIDSTTQAYNNRAITCIKLHRYNEAVNDCNRVISAEPTNVKALLRRGLALEHLEKEAQALADYEAALKIEPTNKIAIDAVKKLRAPCSSKKIKMKIEEETATEEVNVSEMEEIKTRFVPKESKENSGRITWASSQKRKILPLRNSTSSKETSHETRSQVCFCPNAPSSSQHISPLPHMRNIYCSKSLEKSINQQPKLQSIFTNSKMSESSGVIIEEIPNELFEESVESSRTEKNDDKSKQLNGKNASLASGDSQFEMANKTVDLTKEISKKIVEFKEDTTNDRKFEKISTPYEFLRVWHSLKADSELILRARVLRSLTPENIDTVLGNKLDGDMLCIFIRCFERHFCIPEQSKLLHRFLQSLRTVKRFSMICMFLDEKDREVLGKVFHFLESQGSAREDIQDLREAYGITM